MSVVSANGAATPLSPNYVINGAFDIWQRGTSFTNPVNNEFTTDRWRNPYNGSGATLVVSQQTHTPGSNPSGSNNPFFLRYQVTAAGTGNTYRYLDHRIEDVGTLAGQTAVFSFWAKADSARTIDAFLIQAFGTGGSSDVNTAAVSFNATTSWKRFTATFNVPSIAGKTIGTGSFLYIRLALPAGVTMTVDLDEIQLEAGSIATPFRRNSPNLQAELAACQRYYWRNSPGIQYKIMADMGLGTSTTSFVAQINFPVIMRAAPTVVEFSNLYIWQRDLNVTDADIIITNVGMVYPSPFSTEITASAASGITNKATGFIRTSTTAGFLGFSAEL